MKPLRWIAWTVGAFVALLVVVVAIGAVLPQGHVASRTIELSHPPAVVWRTITDVAHYPSWRAGITAVDVLPAGAGASLAWREHSRNGSLGFDAPEVVAPTRFVTRMTDRDIPFGGGWTFQLAPSATGTSLTITERGEVYNPFFRFVSRFVIGHYRSIDTYLADLTRELDRSASAGPGARIPLDGR
ncbi:MAG TPA: SRPBCC domain-containing protein [Candidatus Elarobacter sp.]|nr:SRPBCC domain-containing protein [Candidatus Elarobacter sp.]